MEYKRLNIVLWLLKQLKKQLDKFNRKILLKSATQPQPDRINKAWYKK